MKKLIFITVFIVVCGLSAVVYMVNANASHSQTFTYVPISALQKLIGTDNYNHITVPVTLKFKGKVVNSVFILNTAAPVSYISKELATELGFPAIQPPLIAAQKEEFFNGKKVLVSYEMKPMVLDEMVVANVPLKEKLVLSSDASKSSLEGVGGVLGLDVLRNFNSFKIDFVKHTLVLK